MAELKYGSKLFSEIFNALRSGSRGADREFWRDLIDIARLSNPCVLGCATVGSPAAMYNSLGKMKRIWDKVAAKIPTRVQGKIRGFFH